MFKKFFFLFLLFISASVSSSAAAETTDKTAHETADETAGALLNSYKNEDIKEGLNLIKKINKKGNLTPEIYLLEYEIYKKAGKLSEAKGALLAAANLDEDCYEAYLGLMILSIENNDAESAKKYFDKVLEINPELEESSDILFYYSKICVLNRNYDEALQKNLEAISLNSDNKDYYLNLGKIYLYKKDYIKAVNAFDYALCEDNKINEESYNYLGLANYKRGNYKEALYYFKKAVSLNETNFIYLNNLALCYKSLRDKENFDLTVAKITSLTPETALDFIQLSSLYIDRNNMEKAKEILEEGIKRYPDNLLLKEILNKLNKT